MKKAATDDAAARKARAERLRERIEQLQRGPATAKQEQAAPGAAPKHESPREFIERRMRELEKKKPKKTIGR
jgi:hypothetical protein